MVISLLTNQDLTPMLSALAIDQNHLKLHMRSKIFVTQIQSFLMLKHVKGFI